MTNLKASEPTTTAGIKDIQQQQEQPEEYIPLKPEELHARQTPIKSNLFSWLFITWLDKLMLLGYKKPLQME
ncbi:hypothetical protein HDU76_005529, partial [Blyttiomyces sp. JEL0837]